MGPLKTRKVPSRVCSKGRRRFLGGCAARRRPRLLAKTIACFKDRLQNDIHPIFARRNFEDTFDYAALLPTLRLASHLLTAEPLLPFWAAMFYGNNEPLDPEQVLHAAEDRLPRVFRRPSIIKSKTKACTRARLVFLSRIIKFQLEPKETDYGAICHRWYPKNQPRPPGCEGSGSLILLTKRMYENAVRIIPPGDAECGQCRHAVFQILSDRVALANLMLHELAHAVSNYILDEEVSHEDFFEDCPLAEAGYQWESFTYGGTWGVNSDWTIWGPYDDRDEWGEFVLFDENGFPAEKSARTSTSFFCKFHARCPRKTKGGIISEICPTLLPRQEGDYEIPYRADFEVPKLLAHIPVPESFILDLFNPHFWAVTVPELGRHAFWVADHASFCNVAATCGPRHVGWEKFQFEEKDSTVPFTDGYLENEWEWIGLPKCEFNSYARKRSLWDELVPEEGVHEFVCGGESVAMISRRLEKGLEEGYCWRD